MTHASRRMSEKQVEFLVEWMEGHPTFARGTYIGIESAARLWEEVAILLNALGVTKTSTGWRQYWSYLKCKLRRRANIVRHDSATDTWSHRLTPIGERVLKLVGAVGNHSTPRLRLNSETAKELAILAEQSSVDRSQNSPTLSLTNENQNGTPSPTESNELSDNNIDVQESEDFLADRRVSIEERRLAIEERRLALEEKRLAMEQQRLDLEQRRLPVEKLRLEMGQQLLEVEKKRLTVEEARSAVP